MDLLRKPNRLVQVVGNAIERRLQLATKRAHGADGGNGNESSDQAAYSMAVAPLLFLMKLAKRPSLEVSSNTIQLTPGLGIPGVCAGNITSTILDKILIFSNGCKEYMVNY